MKKILILLCAVCVVCNAAGCSLQETELLEGESQKNNAKEEYAITVDLHKEDENSNVEIPDFLKQMLRQCKDTSKEDVLVEGKNYSEENISIDYPQISYPDSPDIETQINKDLYNAFVSLFRDNWDWDNLTVEAKYQVMLNSGSCLSFLCTSEVCVWGAAHPSKFNFGVTVDMKTGEFISLEDMLDINTFRETIERGDYEVTPAFVVEELSFDHYAEITSYHSVVDGDKSNLYTYYVTPKSVCVLTGVAHAYGDIATICIPREAET